MARSTPKSEFWLGFRKAAPLGIVVGPFGVLFGVLATEAGLNVLEVMAFSFVVLAGAAQITALQMMQDNAPTVIILATALAVNLRMAMYSAALAPHLGAAPLRTRIAVAYFTVDQSFAMSSERFEQRPQMPLAQKIAFFFGTVAPVCPLWYLGTWFGAVLGNVIPPWLPLDFAVPITFVAMMAPALRTRAHVAAGAVGVTVSLACVALPYNLGIMVGGLAGIISGAWVEKRTDAKATP